jgi:hypothetical protein
MKRYWKTIRYIDLCLLWKFEVPVPGGVRDINTILYIRVKKDGRVLYGTHEGFRVTQPINDEDIFLGEFESQIVY